MQDQINPPPPSEVGGVEALGARVNGEDAKCVWEGTVPEPLPKLAHRWSTSHSRWAARASVLLAPNWKLTERDRQVKQRFQALIAEARGLGELGVEHVR